MNRKKWLSLILLCGFWASLLAGTSYDAAVEAYRESRLDAAENALKQAQAEEPSRDDVYLLLGAVYQKQNRYNEAEAALKQGMTLYGIHRENLAFNLANMYYTMNRKEDAVALYSEIAAGSSEYRSGATLNRANCYLSLGDYSGAVADYTAYLSLEPLTSQRSEIERMIALLTRKMSDEEEKEKLAAQQAALEEARRQEAERLAAEEAAKQQALLDEILASLEGVGEETQVLGAGTEDIVIEDEDSDIEE